MSSSNVLIIDDEEKLRNLLARIIKLENFTVTETGSLKSGLKILEKDEIDIVLCDVKLPDGNGVDFVKEIKTKYPHIEIILLTAYGNVPDSVQAMKNGAFDYIMKGDDNEKIIPLLNRALEKAQLQKRVKQLEKLVGSKYSFESIIGKSKPIQQAIELGRKVAVTDTTVLLTGETGTGKEVFAQAIHHASNRNGKSFVAVNCSAFSKEILESEIFGHKAGAFTGAIKDKKGLFEEANEGTIFLDEIGEMPVELQAKLLRVLETSEFIKVGDTKPTKVNVRIVTATNRSLEEEIKQNHFRSDLYYRLSVFQIELPSLRERVPDIQALTEFFIELFCAKINKPLLKFSNEFLDTLKQYSWPGNIRELKNVIERACIISNGNELTANDLPIELRFSAPSHSDSTHYSLSDIEKAHIQKMLAVAEGNKTKAAKLLGIGLTTLYAKIKEYDIQ
ncbi:sigma-54-dependent transcriptional regulator [Ferruginibacter albus]|uniref:sigma-54-dependent transcriptional regulator n=1 Tax=Ferruginibacter albus TaxID=2875540 RepID=UPI001CC5BDC1|nr:sigma-54 dependent transcriptional regulator [Ferruginibacter albus]UAY52334.1 sigma-54 dependent transcriptional regulator [Ferruginibacter albus]